MKAFLLFFVSVLFGCSLPTSHDPLPNEVLNKVNPKFETWKHPNEWLFELPEDLKNCLEKKHIDENGKVWRQWKRNEEYSTYVFRDLRYIPPKVQEVSLNWNAPQHSTESGFDILLEDGWLCKKPLSDKKIEECFEINTKKMTVAFKRKLEGKTLSQNKYFFNADSTVQKIQYQDHGTVSYSYDDQKRLVSKHSSRKNKTTYYQYGANGLENSDNVSYKIFKKDGNTHVISTTVLDKGTWIREQAFNPFYNQVYRKESTLERIVSEDFFQYLRD